MEKRIRKYNNYVGIFDSGLGGISVLREMTKLMPQENFLFFGDSANAPYGERSPEEVCELSERITDTMIQRGAKAIVIACNTATSAAAVYLREKYSDVPIIGVEPALKPAAENDRNGEVLVMATPVTLKLDKFQKLSARFTSDVDCIPLPCPGLADAIEHGDPDSDEVRDLLESLLRPYVGKVSSIVLGCTHYPFVKKQILDIMGSVDLYESGAGTARELRRVLSERGMLAGSSSGDESGRIVFRSSINTPEEIALYRKFYSMDI
jgi:glutamate racemase